MAKSDCDVVTRTREYGTRPRIGASLHGHRTTKAKGMSGKSAYQKIYLHAYIYIYICIIYILYIYMYIVRSADLPVEQLTHCYITIKQAIGIVDECWTDDVALAENTQSLV